MNTPNSTPLWGLLVVATIALAASFWPRSQPERWFSPGESGWEPGTSATQDARPETRGGFRSRAMSGMGGAEGIAWARRNGLTPRLAFSHNMAAIFFPELYAEHPEFFPLVNGERLRPRDGAQSWNPDLGREDVAAWAVDAARRHFEANPTSEGFSVGVNDGLIFGESAETLAMLRRKKPRAESHEPRGECGDRPDAKPTTDDMDGHGWNQSGVRNPEQKAERPDQDQIDHRGHGGVDSRAQDVGAGSPESEAQGSESVSIRAIRGADRLGAGGGWFRGRPDFSNLVFGFTNRVARDVAQTHPDKYVGALAYYWCENAPDFPLEPNVIPFLTADRSQGYDEAFRAEELELQRRWASVMQKPETRNLIPEIGDPRVEHRAPPAAKRANGEWGSQVSGLSSQVSVGAERRLGLYDYLYGSGFLIPRIHTRLLADNLRQARRLGFTDYFAEVNPNWGLDGPMPWLVAQLLQDPEQSREVLLEEYYTRCFGGAAVPMRRFFERCEQQWMRQPGRAYWLKHYRNESQARLFPSEACRELRRLLDEAARQARGDAVRRRVQRVSDAFGVTERLVAFCEARDALSCERLRAETRTANTKMVGRKEAQKAQETPASGGWESAPVTQADGGPVGASLATPECAPACVPAESGSRGVRAPGAAVDRYCAAREEFVSYTEALMKRAPLAVEKFTWADYLRHEPPLRESELRMSDGERTAVVGDASPALRSAPPKPRNLLRNGDFRGPLVAPKRIGRLDYSVAMPEGWITTVEPAEGQSARIEDGVLRLERNKETFVYQWLAATGGARYRATVEVRGRVQPSATASLTLSWLDERQTPLGIKVHRLPEGEWPEWVTLEVAQDLPAEARWVGTGARVQHQLEGDWLEAREFRLDGETETVGGD